MSHSWYHKLSTRLEKLGFVRDDESWNSRTQIAGRRYLHGPWYVSLRLQYRFTERLEHLEHLFVYAGVTEEEDSLWLVGHIMNTYRSSREVPQVEAIFRAMANPSDMPLLAGISDAAPLLDYWGRS